MFSDMNCEFSSRRSQQSNSLPCSHGHQQQSSKIYNQRAVSHNQTVSGDRRQIGDSDVDSSTDSAPVRMSRRRGRRRSTFNNNNNTAANFLAKSRAQSVRFMRCSAGVEEELEGEEDCAVEGSNFHSLEDCGGGIDNFMLFEDFTATDCRRPHVSRALDVPAVAGQNTSSNTLTFDVVEADDECSDFDPEQELTTNFARVCSFNGKNVSLESGSCFRNYLSSISSEGSNVVDAFMEIGGGVRQKAPFNASDSCVDNSVATILAETHIASEDVLPTIPLTPPRGGLINASNLLVCSNSGKRSYAVRSGTNNVPASASAVHHNSFSSAGNNSLGSPYSYRQCAKRTRDTDQCCSDWSPVAANQTATTPTVVRATSAKVNKIKPPSSAKRKICTSSSSFSPYSAAGNANLGLSPNELLSRGLEKNNLAFFTSNGSNNYHPDQQQISFVECEEPSSKMDTSPCR